MLPPSVDEAWSEVMAQCRLWASEMAEGELRPLLRRFVFLSDAARSFVNVYVLGADGIKHLLMQTIALPIDCADKKGSDLLIFCQFPGCPIYPSN